MKFRAAVLAFATALITSLSYAQDANVTEATTAAERWLVHADKMDGSATWDQASSMFQSAVTKAAWTDALKSARTPLGAMKSRQARSAQFTRSLPGAPDGEYVVIQYDTKFENHASGVETVVPMRDKDGSWKVSGYVVR